MPRCHESTLSHRGSGEPRPSGGSRYNFYSGSGGFAMDKACLILLTFCGLARSQPDVDQILKQLAARCRDLYEHGYVVDIDHRRIDQRRFAEGSSDMPRMHGPGDGAIDRIVLGRLSPNLRFELAN